MLTAFELGGDFHSRTAYGMYDHIRNDREYCAHRLPAAITLIA
jgi:hypothetical protein